MAMTSGSTIVGVFSDRLQADRAIDALYDAGFRSDHIGVVTRDQQGNATTTSATTAAATDSAENAGIGATTGLAAGAGIGGLIGLGVLSNVIPVIGPALFAGTLGVIASNAVGGAAIAGLAGTLIGLGVPEEHANHYEKEFAAGRVIVSVNAGGRAAEVRSIMRRFGATSKDPAFLS